MTLDVLVNVANVIYLFSYSVRDILWLRILTVIGATMLLPYYYLQPDPLWPAIAWNVVFTAINIFWITKLLLERRPVQFTDEERFLYRTALRGLKEREALKLFSIGNWTSMPTGTQFLVQGESVDALSLIAEGNVSVELNGKEVDTLTKGNFIGATAFLDRTPGFGAIVTVAATGPVRAIVWPWSEMKKLIAKDANIEVAIEACLGLELSDYLQSSRNRFLQLHLS
ncbi:MAG: cyclic nucleotide-binding domain-containing protein [Hyphomicrobiales bacterium]|nr:cyclic nucleotide-binding domain-containing protein [Hyphomicrobiales bacterium]